MSMNENFAPSTKRNHYSMRNRNAKEVSFDDLRRLFHLPISEVSERVGICTTLLKKMCRKNSLKRWPFRKIRSIIKSIGSLQESYNSSVSEEDKAAFQGRIKDMKNQLHEYFGTSVSDEEMEGIISSCLKEQDEENKKTNHLPFPTEVNIPAPQTSSNPNDLFNFNPEQPNQGQSNEATVAMLNILNTSGNSLLSPYNNNPLFFNTYNNNPLSSTSTSSIFSTNNGLLTFSGISPSIKNESLFNNNNNNMNNNNALPNDIISNNNNNNNNQILSAPNSTINSGSSSSMNNIILDTTTTTTTTIGGNSGITNVNITSSSPPPPLLNSTNNPPSLSKSDIFTLSTSTPLPSLTSLDNTLTNTETSNISNGSTNSIPPQLVGLDVNTGTPSFNSIPEPPTFASLSLTSPAFNMLSPQSPFENYNSNNNGNPRKRAKIEFPTPISNKSNIYNNNNNTMNSMLMSPSILTPTGVEPYSIYTEDSNNRVHAVPYENKVTYTILTMLDCSDIHNFGLTCKDNYKFVQQDSIWEYMVKSRYKRSSKWHFNGNWEKLYHQITGRCQNPYPIPKCLYGCTFVFNNCSSTEYETMIIKLGGTISKSGTMLMDNNITQKFVLVSDKSFQPYANIMPTESPGTPIYLTLPQFKALVNSRYSKFLQI